MSTTRRITDYQPGKWFLERTTRSIYLWAPDSKSPAGHTVEIKQRDYTLDLDESREWQLLPVPKFLKTGRPAMGFRGSRFLPNCGSEIDLVANRDATIGLVLANHSCVSRGWGSKWRFQRMKAVGSGRRGVWQRSEAASGESDEA